MTRRSRVMIQAFFVAAAWCAVPPAAAAFKYVEVGQAAPDFSLESTAGTQVQLQEMVTDGKATAVAFWALWSPRSKPMLDDLEKLLATHRDQGFRVLFDQDQGY